MKEEKTKGKNRKKGRKKRRLDLKKIVWLYVLSQI